MNASREQRLAKIQAASGLTFGLFVFVHTLNTFAAARSGAFYDAFQQTARAIYQHPAVEIAFVFLPLIVHVVVTVMRMRGRARVRPPWRTRLHRATGYFLLAVIVGHIVAVRGPSLFLDVTPGFAGLTFSLAWLPWAFYPYYLLLGMSGIYHGLNGSYRALQTLGLRVPATLTHGWLFWLPVGLGWTLTLLAVLGIGGHLYDIDNPMMNDYAELYETYLGVSLER